MAHHLQSGANDPWLPGCRDEEMTSLRGWESHTQVHWGQSLGFASTDDVNKARVFLSIMSLLASYIMELRAPKNKCYNAL